ncbi:hypothetical protein HJC23_009137 [Cyclotella cryptica]|uniref:IST1-like protein n=1 Tax=Cyclotella cryptica TaxID=29204 RepID=A0ABD3P0H9_9STRA|eukprot:CCRYP_018760-RA/>CCRYP_018760-RA protein AED:0.28 eAED:0.28 QI:167/-1/1/1/-1/1/1/120/364
MRLFTGYNPTKLKTHLKMAITRLQISNNKKSALTKQQIREIATLLAETPPKEEKARIKAEALIRDDNTVEACEILALTCELLSERISLITHSNDCPPDLISSVSTLLWASGVVDVPELIEIRKQFRFKWGKEFEMDAVQNVGGVINERVAAKLSVQPPSAYLVHMYLERIAEEHQVQWKPKQVLTAENMAEPMVPPVGYSVPVGAASGLKPGEYHVSTAPAAAAVSHGHNASAPPFSPSYAVPPMAPTNASVASSSSSSQQQRPYVPVLPITPTSPSGLDDDDEEGDIYVPAMFRSRRGNTDARNNNNETLSSRGRTQSAGEDSRGFDVTSGGDDGSGGNGAVEESYDDLAARFAELQRSSVLH